MSDRRQKSGGLLGDRIAREQTTLRRKLAKIRRWLGADPEAPAAIEALCAQVKGQLADLPEEQRRLFRTTASLTIADLRDSEAALKRYLDIVEQELRRRGSHAVAVKAYGTQPAKAATRLRRN